MSIDNESEELVRLRGEAASLLQEKEQLQKENSGLKTLVEQLEATIYEDELLIQQYKESSTRDFLTGLLNRRGMWEHLNPMLSRLMVPGHKHDIERADDVLNSLSLLYLDIDFFKNINDTYGDHIGDKVIQVVAEMLDNGLIFGRELRKADKVVRYGGEEFIVIMPAMSKKGFQEFLRAHPRKLEIEFADGDLKFMVTLSAGFAEHKPGQDFKETIRRGWAALKTAKKTGRNRIVIAA